MSPDPVPGLFLRLGRYGGEELALILPETDLAGALKLAVRVQIKLETTPVELPSGETLHARASFAAARKPKPAEGEI